MTPEEAVKVVELIAQLWPTPSLKDERMVFYVSALTVIPDSNRAIRVVNDLFITERWQPTPGDVIDRALLFGDAALREWQKIIQSATDAQHRRSVNVALDPLAAATLRHVCGGLLDVPLERGSQLDRIRERFISEYVDRLRQSTSRKAIEGKRELGTGSE
jgi:hypothetical protein